MMLKKDFCVLFILISLLAAIQPLFAYDFYWETPQELSSSESRFPQAASYNGLNIVVWEEVEKTEKNNGLIWLSAQITDESGKRWETIRRFAGPYAYSGDVPNVFSVAINKNNTIAIAVQSGPQKISTVVSVDKGKSFTSHDIYQSSKSLVAPRIFRSSNNTFTLFAASSDGNAFHLKTARSIDGVSWTAFSSFADSPAFTNPFLPTLHVIDGELQRDCVVFQAFHRSGDRLSYQLYATMSSDGGLSWSQPVLLSTIDEGGEPFYKYYNQRPNLFWYDNELYVAWERSYFSSTETGIYVALVSPSTMTIGAPERITPTNSSARQPTLFKFDNTLAVLWFDNRRGIDSVYIALKKGYIWDDERLSSGSQAAVFPCPVVINYGKDFHVFWEQEKANKEHRVIRLSTDRSVEPPIILPHSFIAGKRSAASTASFEVIMPEDSSGIAGYSWIFTNNKQKEPSKTFMEFPKKQKISVTAEEDGQWYLKARVQDMAGNWSETSSLSYYRDTTPPQKPQLVPPDVDDEGFLLSNTYAMSWSEPIMRPEDDGVAGYTYSLDYIAPLGKQIEKIDNLKGSVPLRILTQDREHKWYNRDNGIYLFSVAAVDTVGNVGDAASIPIYLNKYIPYTTIWSVNHT
ncbi:MAG TPA: sialidase family protein, partial [Treponemataceae bacterium]|nr:sialidase family protein [Treponemataceae bacterium]